MYTKTETLRHELDAASAESIADTLQHIGADLFAKEDNAMAIKWSRRAHETLSMQQIDQLSVAGLELRLAICDSLIRALLAAGSLTSVHEAADLVACVESEVGDKPIVLHWRLDLIRKGPGESFDADAYTSILRRMMRSFDFSERTFQFLLHNITELRERSQALSRGLMDELLLHRAIQSGRADWTAKAIVRRVWMATMENDPANAVHNLKTCLDAVLEAGLEPADPDVTGACHSVCVEL